MVFPPRAARPAAPERGGAGARRYSSRRPPPPPLAGGASPSREAHLPPILDRALEPYDDELPDAEPAHPRLRAAARLAYVGVVLLATAMGLHAQWELADAAWRLRRGLSPLLHFGDVLDAARNLALFAGLGVVWAVTARDAGAWRVVSRATVVGTVLSVAVETLQLFSPVRWASIVDVATNGGGALAGALVTTIVIRAAAGRRTVGALAVAPAFLLTFPYVGATLHEAVWSWGRPEAVPGASGGPATRWPVALAWMHAHPLALPTWPDALIFAPAGALAALWLAERGVRPRLAGTLATVACALLWGAAEVTRGVTGGDMRPLSVAWRVGWSAVGAALAAGFASRPHWRARLLGVRGRDGARIPPAVTGYAIVVLLWMWRPYYPEPSLGAMLAKLTPDAFTPLAAQRASYNLYGVADIAIDFLLFVPLGAALGARPLRRRGPLAGMLPAVWLAALSELGQVVVARRVFDVTDILVQVAGAACGWAVLRQADRARALAAAQSAVGNVSGGSGMSDHDGARSRGTTARVSSKW